MDAAPESRPAAPHAKGGPVIPAQPKWHGRLAAHAAVWIARILAATLRWSWDDRAGVVAPTHNQPVIFAIWHNRILLSAFIYRHLTRGKANRRLATLISASRDGGLIAYVMQLFGLIPARGSSSRRGAAALLDLVRHARSGCDIAITPDGPRGPRYQAQEGIIVLAQVTGLPIVPVAYRLSWKKVLRSWDGFQIPLPFSRCDVTFGAPLQVPRELTPDQVAALRAELESRLMAITRD
jgi:lysophospholipid acyltransferase (LPLAT)-like uncharacterized protein